MKRRDILIWSAACVASYFSATLLARTLFPVRHDSEDNFNAEFEALKLAAKSSGPARARLKELKLLNAVPSIPFDPSRAAIGTRDTHFIHYEHHYLEYFRRWNDPEVSPDKSRHGHQNVLLHEIYFHQIARAKPVNEQDHALAKELIQNAPKDTAWMLKIENDWRFETSSPTFDPKNPPAISYAIDCATHAWLLDYPDLETYLAEFLSACPPPKENRS